MSDVLLLVKGFLYQATSWPKSMPNPGKNKYLVYRDGVFAGVTKSKKDFERRVHDGSFDAAIEVPGQVV